MKEITLFFDKNGNGLTNTHLLRALEEIRAYECSVLYIHSSLSFGSPNPELKRNDILSSLHGILSDLKVPTICMPTYTFSFCNNTDFDPVASRTKMGTLNEYFRTQKNVVRSHDPLLSIAVEGKDIDLANAIGNESVGKDSSFDLLHKKDDVKFLFLGTRMGDCFTYMHYLEWLYKVDYRYDRKFLGNIILDGKKQPREYTLFVRYRGINPNDGSYIYEQAMYENGAAKKIQVGNSFFSIVEEKNACSNYKAFLDSDPNFFITIDENYPKKDKTFHLEKEMVAL